MHLLRYLQSSMCPGPPSGPVGPALTPLPWPGGVQVTCSNVLLFVLRYFRVISFAAEGHSVLETTPSGFISLQTIRVAAPLSLSYLIYMVSLPHPQAHSDRVAMGVTNAFQHEAWFKPGASAGPASQKSPSSLLPLGGPTAQSPLSPLLSWCCGGALSRSWRGGESVGVVWCVQVVGMASIRGVSVPMYTTLRRTTVAFTMAMEYLIVRQTYPPEIMAR